MKKVKLFTTIASLCLAVALMAFGVYAATSVAFNVSGTISFTATGIDGSWTWTTTQEDVANKGDYTVTASGDEDNNEITIAVSKVTTDGSTDAETAQTYSFVITGEFSNSSDKNADLAVSDNESDTFFTVSTISNQTVNSTGAAAANGKGSVAIKVSFTIDPTVSITADTYTFSVTFEATPEA